MDLRLLVFFLLISYFHGGTLSASEGISALFVTNCKTTYVSDKPWCKDVHLCYYIFALFSVP